MAKQLGAGRLLIATYGIFSISASARALFQISTKFEEAPVAYALSALSALVYVLATFLLGSDRYRRFAKFAVWFELVGVMVVGVLSLAIPELFNHPSVWSGFGSGYAFIPLILPLAGLLWLRKSSA